MLKISLRACWKRCRPSLVGLVVFALAPHAALGRQSETDYLAQVNAMVAPQGLLVEAADTLFPLIVAMDRPPQQARRVRDVSLIGPGTQEWEAWSAWAQGQPQQDVLAGLLEVTDPDGQSILGFPYGSRGLPASWAGAGLKVELGRPPVLARAHDQMDYLSRFNDVAKLCTIEATRLAREGDAERCMSVLQGWLGLGRLVVGRVFYLEKLWGMTTVMASLERMRDLAHAHPDLFDAALIRRVTDDLDLKALKPNRFEFPVGEKLAAHQLLRLTIQERGGPYPAQFAVVMGRLEAGDRAFRAFGGAAGWEERAESHASWFDTMDEIDKIFGDWDHRWSINDMFHPIMRQPTAYKRMDKTRFAMVERVTTGLDDLFDMRMRLLVEITGTRSALGVVGFMAEQGVWPPALSAVQPRYVRKLDNDPWNYEPTRDIRDIFQFFVPIRDQPRGPRELPKPHVISVVIGGGEMGTSGAVAGEGDVGIVFTQFTEDMLRDAMISGIPKALWDSGTGQLDVEGFKTFITDQVKQLSIEQQTMNSLVDQIKDYDDEQVRAVIGLVDPTALGEDRLRTVVRSLGLSQPRTFTVPLDDSSFILYSVSKDGRLEMATSVGAQGTDILIWPPLLSIERQY